MSSSLNPSGKSSITILVAGDPAVGKTSLISSLVSASFNDRVPPVLQAIMVPGAVTPEGIPLTLIDTSSDPAHVSEIAMHLSAGEKGNGAAASAQQSSKASMAADVVLLVVSRNVTDSFARVESYWLPLIESYARYGQPRIPVVLAINQERPADGAAAAAMEQFSQADHLDRSYASDVSHIGAPAMLFQHLLHAFRLSAVMPCSSKHMLAVDKIFFTCTRVVLSPIEPLFDLYPTIRPSPTSSSNSTLITIPPTQKFKLLTQRAMLRIFRLFDADGDGVLSFAETDALHQVTFQGKLLNAAVWEKLIRMLREQGAQKEYVRVASSSSHSRRGTSDSVSSHHRRSAPDVIGVTFRGLLHFHHEFLIKDRHLWNLWKLLHHFGYTLPPQGQMNLTANQNSSLPTPALTRGASLGGPLGAASSSSQSSSAAPSSSASSSPLPPLGSLTLKDHSYCTLPFPYQKDLSYELSSVAVEFLSGLFRKYANAEGLLGIRSGGGGPLNPSWSAHASAAAAANEKRPPESASICSLTAASDLELLFLTSPDIPFNLASFWKFVPPAHGATTQQQQQPGKEAAAGEFLTLNAWLSCWALLLYNWSTTQVALPPVASTPSSGQQSSNLSSSFTAVAPSSSTLPSVPNPEILLRYLIYLCFPVAPAYSDSTAHLCFPFTMKKHAENGRSEVRAHLPRIQECVHLTARNLGNRSTVEQATSLNEVLMGVHASSSMGGSGSAASAAYRESVRSYLSSPSAVHPHTVCCFLLSSPGAGRSTFIDCFLGVKSTEEAGGGAARTMQQQQENVIPGLGPPMTRQNSQGSESGAASAAADGAAASSASSSSQQHPRTYANRLPLSHVPNVSAAADALSSSTSAAAPSSATSTDFLLIKDFPSKLSTNLLTSLAFTPTSCHLVLLMYDATSSESLRYVHERLQVCFERRLPVLVIQTHVDCANASNPTLDFAELDFTVRVEQFSARAFQRAVANPATAAMNAYGLQIFQRIHRAAAHPQAFILTSLSAAARSAMLTRRILWSILIGSGTIIGAVAVHWWRKNGGGPRMLFAGGSSSSAATSQSVASTAPPTADVSSASVPAAVVSVPSSASPAPVVAAASSAASSQPA